MSNVKQIVMPGDPVEVQNLKPRNGVYKCGDNKYCSQFFGILQESEQFVDVVPFTGKYVPRRSDKVIGKVIEIGPSMWIVDISSTYTTLLHMNDTPWRVTSGELKRYMNVGDYVYAKVLSINEIKESWITMKDVGLKKLEGGTLVSLPAPKVPRIIGKGGSMVNMIKDSTHTRIMVGQNGVIWLDGAPENVIVAIGAIRMVEEEAHTVGLTDRVKKYLEDKKGEIVGNSE
jgi:exosome complex component RRP4